MAHRHQRQAHPSLEQFIPGLWNLVAGIIPCLFGIEHQALHIDALEYTAQDVPILAWHRRSVAIALVVTLLKPADETPAAWSRTTSRYVHVRNFFRGIRVKAVAALEAHGATTCGGYFENDTFVKEMSSLLYLSFDIVPSEARAFECLRIAAHATSPFACPYACVVDVAALCCLACVATIQRRNLCVYHCLGVGSQLCL